uniref:Acyl-CoA dehydrogenase n=1 Tax=Haemonchus placei TaxID=6290 RepID=A0A0N4WSA0_HAEPC
LVPQQSQRSGNRGRYDGGGGGSGIGRLSLDQVDVCATRAYRIVAGWKAGRALAAMCEE